jgi:hypothetical protein
LANIALSALDEHFDRQWQEQMGTNCNQSGPWLTCGVSVLGFAV